MRVLLAVLGMLLALPVDAAELAPHRAVYSMALERRGNQPGPVSAVSGTILIEFAKQCDGWTVEQRDRTTMRYDDSGQDVEDTSQYVTWEAEDGTRFRFLYRHTVENEPPREVRGSATLGPDGGEVRLTRPETATRPLTRGTLFPTAHQRALLNAARAGETWLKRDVFDGTEEDGAYEVTVGIGRVQAPDTGAAHELLRLRWWPIRMALFAPGNTSGTADYEVGIELLENGVSRSLLYDYGTLAIRATLTSIERLPQPQC
jgi:hypothetical protein